MDDWIESNTRLPEINTKVLCYLSFGVIECATYNGKFFLFDFLDAYASESYFNAATHWMPLSSFGYSV